MARLAIEGGSPARSQLLPYGRQTVDESDIDAVVQVLRSDWLTTGPKVAEFEAAFAEQIGARFAVAVSNGTAALHAAAYAAGLGPGDSAIVTAMTFVASANCVRYQGADVQFCDVRRDTLNIDTTLVESLISPVTSAIVAVDFTGQPADFDELRMLADAHGLILIEDAAHAVGATYRGRPLGALADLATFSFHPVKHITTGEGGMVTTNNPEFAARLRTFRNHGLSSDHHQRESAGTWEYQMVDLGYNYRITDFQSALGLSQLTKLEGWLARRRSIARKYQAAFAGMPEVEAPTELSDRTSAWHIYVIRFNLDLLRVGRADIYKALRAENIGVNVHYRPVPCQPYYQRSGPPRGHWAVAAAEYERMLTLPIFPAMSDADVDDVIGAVAKVVQHYRR